MEDNRKESFLSSKALKREDSFYFDCDLCGNCCKGREDILLSPYDVFRLAKGLNMTTEAVIKKYCSVYLGSQSRLPVISLYPVAPNAHCPFLSDGCLVHDFKPSVCLMYPLGRYLKEETVEVMYFLQDITCGEKMSLRTVDDWVKGLDEETFVTWSNFVMELTQNEKIRTIFAEDILSPAADILFHFLVFALYTDYDIEMDFLSQLKEVRNTVMEILGSL